jgi:hypothetical protein
MVDPLEKQVLIELKKGVSKENILKKLATADNREDLVWYLNYYPTGKGRREAFGPNWILSTVLLTVTVKKLYFIALVQINAASVDLFTPLLLVELLVPVINFYALSKILRFQKQGYQFMAVLGLLALVRPENRVMPELAMYCVIIGLSVFLLLRLFPKNELVKE